LKILTVSDSPSKSLEKIVEDSPEKLRNVDVIVSCGDLDRSYLEFLVDGLHKPLFFICGNHPGDEGFEDEETPEEERLKEIGMRVFDISTAHINHIAGFSDLHGRVEAFGDYIFAGFSGAMLYGDSEQQFTDQDMARVVNKVIRDIKWLRLKEKLSRRQPRKLVIVSHAPIYGIHDKPDAGHRGFKSFLTLLKKTSPVLWLHGHIHIFDQREKQVSRVGDTTIVNAFNCKVVNIIGSKVEVTPHCQFDNQSNSLYHVNAG
jgi:uncharacterized protein